MRPDDALIYLQSRVNTALESIASSINDPGKAYPIMCALKDDVNEVVSERIEAAYGITFSTDFYLDGTPVLVTAKSGTLNRRIRRIRKPGDPQGISDAEKAWLEGKDLEK